MNDAGEGVLPNMDWDALAQSLSARRAAQLRQHMSLHSTAVFVLIDPLLGDPLLHEPLPEGLSLQQLEERRSRAWGRASHALQLPAGIGLDAALGPYMVALDGAHDPWLECTVGWAVQETLASWRAQPGQGCPHRIGGWVQSAAPVQTLTAHLSAWLVLSTEAPTAARYLRIADRRVWSLAVHVLGMHFVTQRLAPIEHWHWLDAHAAWQHLSAASQVQTHAAQAQPLTRWSQAQWAVMNQGPVIHRYLAEQQALRVSAAHELEAPAWPPVGPAQWQAALLRQTAPDLAPHLAHPHTAQEGEYAGEHGY